MSEHGGRRARRVRRLLHAARPPSARCHVYFGYPSARRARTRPRSARARSTPPSTPSPRRRGRRAAHPLDYEVSVDAAGWRRRPARAAAAHARRRAPARVASAASAAPRARCGCAPERAAQLGARQLRRLAVGARAWSLLEMRDEQSRAPTSGRAAAPAPAAPPRAPTAAASTASAARGRGRARVVRGAPRRGPLASYPCAGAARVGASVPTRLAAHGARLPSDKAAADKAAAGLPPGARGREPARGAPLARRCRRGRRRGRGGGRGGRAGLTPRGRRRAAR